MAPHARFLLSFKDSTSEGSPTAHIIRFENKKQEECATGQDLWDKAQNSFESRTDLTREVTTAMTLYIRIERNSKGRALCLLRVPDQKVEYVFRYFKGISQWMVRGMVNRCDGFREAVQIEFNDFYGYELASLSLEVFRGLEGLLRYEWDITHSRTCQGKHFDVYISIPKPNLQDSQAPAEPKKVTHLLICGETTVWTLFRALFGVSERNLTPEILSYCLTEILRPSGEELDWTFGEQYIFSEVKESEITMQETEWFKTKSNVTLVANKHQTLSLTKLVSSSPVDTGTYYEGYP